MLDTVAFEFFRSLAETPSVSGFEQPVQRLVREWAGRYADEVRHDLHGNVIAVRNPGGSPRIVLDGHCDQIGLLVVHIDDRGFIYTQPVGGWDRQILLGQAVQVWTADGPLDGVISRKATHLLTDAERSKIPEFEELWIDLGVTSGSPAPADRVKIGDPVTVRLGIRRINGDLVTGPGLDNSAGLFTVLETLRRLAGQSFDPAVYVVSAVQEEIGLRGTHTSAFAIEPEVGFGIDVTHATDCPTINSAAYGDVRLGRGPVLFRGPNVNPAVLALAQRVAADRRLPYQMRAANKPLSNDTNALQLIRQGVATCGLSIPLRYMHSPCEMIALADLDAAADLLAGFIQALPRGVDLRPGA